VGAVAVGVLCGGRGRLFCEGVLRSRIFGGGGRLRALGQRKECVGELREMSLHRCRVASLRGAREHDDARTPPLVTGPVELLWDRVVPRSRLAGNRPH